MFMASSFLSSVFSLSIACSMSVTKITTSSKFLNVYDVTRVRKNSRPSRDGSLPTSIEARAYRRSSAAVRLR